MSRDIKVKDLLPEIEEAKEDEVYIYTLFNDSECIYVGQSINLSVRICQHIVDGKDFDRVAYIICKKKDGNSVEANKIIALSPTLNRTLPKTDEYMSMTKFKAIVSDLVSKKAGLIAFTSKTNIYVKTDLAVRLIEEIKKIKLGE